MMMWIPFVLTSFVLVAALRIWATSGRHHHELGRMSEQWIAECQASQQAAPG